MAKPCLCLTILVFFNSLFPPITALDVERQALLELKNHLHDPFNNLQSWIEADSPCKYVGITCDKDSGHVTHVSLGNMSLSGELSPSISKLRRLASLSLPSNSISGKLPTELTNCSNLRLLNLNGNKLSGKLPDLSSLQNLESLDLSMNHFTGEFPYWVANLSRLVYLGVGGNRYLAGEIPDSLGNLKNLTYLFLGSSNLMGKIPDSIFNLTRLDILDLSVNRVSGSISRKISFLKNLTKLELYGNNLTGEIPPEMSNLTLLREIDISGNSFYGALPPGIGAMKRLSVFECHDNNFSGDFPAGFGDLEHLTSFSIYENRFSGEFPANLGKFSELDTFDISENQFSGSFPRFLCSGQKLLFLLAVGNNFSGGLPDSYGECKSLRRFRINRNRFSGEVPVGVWALPNATMIDFGDNEFSGAVASSIASSSSLKQLSLQNNRFSGELPAEISRLEKLERLYLSNNRFSGRIPAGIGNLPQLWSLHLEMNSLSGNIPSELGRCERLIELNLASNSLDGNIPDSISLISSLNSLNVSGNQLSGRIPEGLNKLKLSSLDMSDNRFSGEVPGDLLVSGGAKAFLGNPELCLSSSSRFSVYSGIRQCREEQPRRQNFRWFVIFTIATSVLLAAVVGTMFLSYRSFKNHERDTAWEISWFRHVDMDPEDICGLKDDNLIGSGGSGRVFRLDLKKNRGTVAVKELWREDGEKTILAEVETLGKIRHRNVLNLYACLVKGSSTYLVLEFMANGSLWEAIHGGDRLSWSQRYRIAVGAARGIAYLHHDCSPPIIHRDIKSSNILIDGDYEAKIADFGVAKVVGKSMDGSEFSCIAGTHGYMAPELSYTLKANEKSDVYSFGVVLLELITGRKPIDHEYGEGKDLVYWTLTHLKDRGSIDKLLDQEIASDTTRDEMIKVLKLAVFCTSNLPSLRPTMRQVVSMLVDVNPNLPSN